MDIEVVVERVAVIVVRDGELRYLEACEVEGHHAVAPLDRRDGVGKGYAVGENMVTELILAAVAEGVDSEFVSGLVDSEIECPDAVTSA